MTSPLCGLHQAFIRAASRNLTVEGGKNAVDAPRIEPSEPDAAFQTGSGLDSYSYSNNYPVLTGGGKLLQPLRRPLLVSNQRTITAATCPMYRPSLAANKTDLKALQTL